jgi:putative transposase
MKKIAGSEMTRKMIAELMEQGFDASELMRTGMRLMIEQALEEEVTDVLGRERYQRTGEPAKGYRNGTRKGHMRTAEGVVEFGVPQVTGTEEPFVSQIREQLPERSEELGRLAIEMYARGLSMRDIEKTFTDESGRCALSKTAASEIAERLWQDYQAFAARDLSGLDIVFLFVDGVAEKLHLGQRREPVLASWGITMAGEKHLLGLYTASKEDTDSARQCLRDLKERGMKDPILVVSDGAPGLIRAITEVFPFSLRQRCLAHRMRNLAVKVPEERINEVTAHARAAYQAISPMAARNAAEEFRRLYQNEFPSAVACFEDDFEACIAHLRLPIAQRRVARTTNLLERLFGEERRRTKVIPHAFGEKAVLKLMFAALVRASQTWLRVTISEFEQHQLRDLRQQLKNENPASAPFENLDASRLQFSSKKRT